MVANNAPPSTARARSSLFGGLGIVLASIALSIVSYGPLREMVRIRWTIGTYPQYGPEHAPALVVLVAFPAVIAGLFIGARWLRRYLERADGVEDVGELQAIYDICMLVILGMVVGVQILIIALNL